MVPTPRKAYTRKQSIVSSFKFRDEFFLRIFLPHLDGHGSGTEVGEFYEYDEFLWETTEVLLVSIYHWAEHELKRVLSLCSKAPTKQDINRLDYPNLEKAYAALGITLQGLKGAAKVESIRHVVNAIKHNGSYPDKKTLKALRLPETPTYEGEPTVYYGLLTSSTIQRAMLKKLGGAESDSTQPVQETLLRGAIFHVRVMLNHLVETIPEEKFRKLGGKAHFWPPAV